MSPDNHDAIELYEQRQYVRWKYKDVDTFLHTFAEDGKVIATHPAAVTIYIADLYGRPEMTSCQTVVQCRRRPGAGT